MPGPQAREVADWLQRHLPHAQLVDVDSTAYGVQIAAKEKGAAAIAQRRPLSLVVDDAARADASSMALLGRLLRQHTTSRCWLVWLP